MPKIQRRLSIVRGCGSLLYCLAQAFRRRRRCLRRRRCTAPVVMRDVQPVPSMSMSNLALSEPTHIDLTGDDDVSPPSTRARVDASPRPAQTYPYSSYPHLVPPHAPKPPPMLHTPAYRPVFPVPSLPRPHQHLPPPQNGTSLIHPFTTRPASTYSVNNVIDLTHSPSPPSSPLPLSNPLPDDLSPRTPVCIGQIAVTALVLYPVPYLQAHDPTRAEGDWASVRLQYEHNPHKPPGTTETIHIKTPHIKTLTGELSQGEAFGVVEQKVAAHLGPMLGKGLIRLDAQVRRGMPNVSVPHPLTQHRSSYGSSPSFHYRCLFTLQRVISSSSEITSTSVDSCSITHPLRTTPSDLLTIIIAIRTILLLEGTVTRCLPSALVTPVQEAVALVGRHLQCLGRRSKFNAVR